MPMLKKNSSKLVIANHLCSESTWYSRSPRLSIFSAGIFFAGVGIGGFLWPPSLGVSLLKAFAPVHMLKKYSGIPMMYFRLNNHRSTILIGKDAMHNNKNTIT